jgi:DnaJ-class molecular chaperone
MKCIKCNGSGLQDQSTVCPVCQGFGVVPGEEKVEVKPEVKEAKPAVVAKAKKLGLTNKKK